MSTITGEDIQAKPGLAKPLLLVALVTAAILAIPLVAMQFTAEVNWTGLDFLAAGALLALAGLVLTFVLRKLRSRQSRLLAIGLIGLGFLYCWAEMAVGIFTNLGS